MGPLEIKSFEIVKRMLDGAHSSGLGIGRMVCDDDEMIIDIEQDVEDYLFHGDQAWYWPGLKLDEVNWRGYVEGVETESD
jgi:hypothetical protein